MMSSCQIIDAAAFSRHLISTVCTQSVHLQRDDLELIDETFA